MSQKVARVGDSVAGNCILHGSFTHAWIGTIATGSDLVSVEGKAAARVGDTGTCSCGHHFRITHGSPILTDRGIPISRVGDAVEVIESPTGVGTITSGASTTTSE